jgi:phosphoribosylaminoimidazolecarboxamide formyltransferase/IMP cyclohydrolase
MTLQQALFSVSDKTGLPEFAQGLAALGVKLLSTGGTARLLEEANLPVTEIGAYTGFPEMLDGRVKTLHPKVHGGILARRDLPEHQKTLEAHGIPMIDLVCVNLYPFKETIARPGVTLAEAIENIDIGGPCLLRAAAKNHAHVTVLCDPADYAPFAAEMGKTDGDPGQAFRRDMARKAFARTSAYDLAISQYLEKSLG